MKILYAFTKKEFIEFWRTRKMLILWLVFAILGIMSPLLAKLTPEILRISFDSEWPLPIDEPTSLDSWSQFYQNLSQIGIYLMMILFSGIVNREVNQGTLIPLVTKGLKRETIIVSKYCLMIIQWTSVLILSFLVTLAYTSYYFSDGKSPDIFQGVVAFWLFGLFLLAATLLMSTIMNSNYSSMIVTIIVVVVLYLINLFEKLAYWNPISLISVNVALVQGDRAFSDYFPAVSLTLIASLLMLLLTIAVFKRKKL
ncbi:ABC transporter permease [Enterococcus olivae]